MTIPVLDNFLFHSGGRRLNPVILRREREPFSAPASPSHRHRPPVEAREPESAEVLVPAGAEIFEDADGDFLAEEEAGQAVGAPVYAGGVAAEGNVGGEFVELSTDGERGAIPGLENEAIRGDDDGVVDGEGLVEEGLEHGGAGAGDDGVACGVGRVEGRAFGVGHGQEARAVGLGGKVEDG